MERAETELVSGTLNYSDDPNATFRFMAWFEAFQRFAESPVLGEAYGIPFKFDLDESDARPHNTYLTVLYKMGVLGLMPLVLLLPSFQRSGWTHLPARKLGRRKASSSMLSHRADVDMSIRSFEPTAREPLPGLDFLAKHWDRFQNDVRPNTGDNVKDGELLNGLRRDYV